MFLIAHKNIDTLPISGIFLSFRYRVEIKTPQIKSSIISKRVAISPKKLHQFLSDITHSTRGKVNPKPVCLHDAALLESLSLGLLQLSVYSKRWE